MPDSTELNHQDNRVVDNTLSEDTGATPTNIEQTTIESSNPDMSEIDNPGMDEIDQEVADAMASMAPEDLAELGSEITSDNQPAPGTEIIGTVVALSDEDIFLQFGVKTQGVMPRSQFGKKEPIEVGRRVDVVVDRFDRDADLLIVSRKGTLQRATWTNLSKGMIVEGRVTGVIRGGLEINVNGIRAFMPGSHADLIPMKDVSLLLNQTIQSEVIELDRREKNVIVSRRKLLERERTKKREALKNELEVGQTRKGIVRRITDFGAFVDIGGLDGLLHIRDLSWGSVEKVADVVTNDQEVEVVILKIDKKRNRVSLGLKQAQPDPWSNVEEKYTLGTSLKARIIRTASFGAFAELEPGVEGLIPISEMSWTRIKNTSDVVSVGDMVDVVVIRIEVKKHRLALSMKQAQEDPWANVLESFAEKSIVKGKVMRLTSFGAFVELVPGVEGLIHISELSDKRVKTCSEVVEVGQEVEARVLGVNQDDHRISLSIKAIHAPAQETGSASEEKPKRKKRKKPLRGGLTSHFEW